LQARYKLLIHVDEDSREKLDMALSMAYNLLDVGGGRGTLRWSWSST
jgi:hypothetical protein